MLSRAKFALCSENTKQNVTNMYDFLMLNLVVRKDAGILHKVKNILLGSGFVSSKFQLENVKCERN
jgi:hypothetical protein